jgi:hypothetical protein
MSESPAVLFNAISHPVSVLVEDQLRPLPRRPQPRVTNLHEDVATVTLALPAPSQDPSTDPSTGPAAGAADVVGGEEFELEIGTAVARDTWDLPPEQPGVLRYLVEAALLARLRHRGDLLAPATYSVAPAADDLAEQPARFALRSVYRAVRDVGPEVENLTYREDVEERMAELRAEARARASKTPPRRLPDPWQAEPEDRSVTAGIAAGPRGAAGQIPVEGDTWTEEQLRQRVHDHPDVAVLLRLRRRRIAERAYMLAGDESRGDAYAGMRARHGIDDSPPRGEHAVTRWSTRCWPPPPRRRSVARR